MPSILKRVRMRSMWCSVRRIPTWFEPGRGYRESLIARVRESASNTTCVP